MTFENVNLTEYFEIVGPGVTPFKGTKKYIATGSLETGKITSFDEVNYASRPSRANMEVKENDVMFAKMKDTEKIFHVSKEDAEHLYSTGFSILRIKDARQFYPKFVFYWLTSNEFQDKKNKECTGATQKALNETRLKKFKIPKPPLETQRKIAALLEKAEKLKSFRADADKLTDEFLKSVFYEMFGGFIFDKKFPKTKIGLITEVVTGGTPDRQNKDFWEGGTIPWVKTGEVNFNLITKTDEFITKHGLTNSNAVLVPCDSILIAMYGQGKTRGKSAKLCIEATTNQACAIILPSKKYSTNYLWKYLTFSYEELRNLGRGGNQPNLNLSMIKNFEVYLPNMEIQDKFSELVKIMDQLKQSQSYSKQSIDDLFNALMQKAFKGETEV